MVLPRVPHPAVRHHRPLARPERRLRRQVLDRVRVLARRAPAVVHARRLVHHQPHRLQLAPRRRQRVLDPLVRADGPPEHDALARVDRCAPECRETEPDGFAGEEDALSVHAVHDVFEAFGV